MSTTNGHEKSGTPVSAAAAAAATATVPASQSMDLLALNFNSPTTTTSNAAPAVSTHSKTTTTPQKSDQEALLDIFGGPISAPAPTLPAATANTTAANTNAFDPFFSSSFDMAPPAAAAAVAAAAPANHHLHQTTSFTPILAVTDQHMQFLFCNSEVLVDHASIRIMSKAEFKRNLGRLTFDITNKTPFTFASFQITPANDDPTAASLLKIMVKPLDNPAIQPGTTVQQVINVECLNEFSHVPQVYVQFR